ncbi:unnamed protein product [Ophioblennius macclurei]
MFGSCLVLLLLLSGGGAFFLHDTQLSLCLQDSSDSVSVAPCDLRSESQQWVWTHHAMLMGVASSRCLWAAPGEPAQTRSCDPRDAHAAGLTWDCDRDHLISRNSSLLLSVVERQVTLAADKTSRWRSLDQGDVCQPKLRLRRASDDADESEAEEEEAGDAGAMSEKQREKLQWFYRTEDATTWKFVLLGVAFVCLLIGFLLLGMGSMANKSRKKIAKYKAAASLVKRVEGEELRGFSSVPSHSEAPGWEVGGSKAGDIVVTWKDGNTSCLYPDPTQVEQVEQEEEVEEVKEVVEGKEKAEEEEEEEVTPE